MKSLPGLMKRMIALCLIMLAAFAPAGIRAQEAPALQEAFCVAAFSVEYGDQGNNALHRFEEPLYFYFYGDRTDEDKLKAMDFLGQLKNNVRGLPEIYITMNKDQANATVAYVPLEDMADHVSGYRSGNWGFVSFFWDGNGQMYRMEIAIASDVTSQKERNHLLMEEIVGGLGLTNDIDSHPDSIIYQPWTTTQQLSQLDWELLNLLYDSRLQCGMTWRQTKRALGW